MSNPNEILYSLIARHGGAAGKAVVLSEHTATTGNFQTVARKILEKVPNKDNKMTINYDKFLFNVLVMDGLVYVCMTRSSEQAKKRTIFAFLDDIKRLFNEKYTDKVMSIGPGDSYTQFAPTLQDRMTYYSQDPALDKVSQVQGQIQDVKGIMVENVDNILARGEKLSLLVEKTEEMSQEAYTFKKSSTELKNKMWLKNLKMTLMIATPVIIGIFWLIFWACGGIKFPNCGGK